MNQIRLIALDVKQSKIQGFSDEGVLIKTIVTNCGGVPDGIEVDPINRYIYWTNMGEHHQGERFGQNDGFIERCDFDGTNRTILVPKGATFTPKQLQLDLIHGLMYWSDREGMRVMRATLAGENLTTLIERGAGAEDRLDETRYCVGIALDTENGYLYWTQKGPAKGGTGRIFRAGLELPLGQDPAHRDDVELLVDQLPEPIDLALNSLTGHLYWTDRGTPPRGNTLNRIGIREQTVTRPEVLVSGLQEAIGLALDLTNERVFFSDLGGHLYCACLDGSQHRVIYTGTGMFTGLAYLEGKARQNPIPCDRYI